MSLSPRLVLVLLSLASLSACLSKHENGPSVDSLAVTGTDGMAASKSRPGELAPTQNLGRFSVGYSVSQEMGQRVTLLVRHNDHSETLFESCCGNTGCGGGATLSCTYTVGNMVNCQTSTTDVPSNHDLSTFFSQTGGIPNSSDLVVRNCSNTCYSGSDPLIVLFAPKAECGEASLPVVFR